MVKYISCQVLRKCCTQLDTFDSDICGGIFSLAITQHRVGLALWASRCTIQPLVVVVSAFHFVSVTDDMGVGPVVILWCGGCCCLFHVFQMETYPFSAMHTLPLQRYSFFTSHRINFVKSDIASFLWEHHYHGSDATRSGFSAQEAALSRCDTDMIQAGIYRFVLYIPSLICTFDMFGPVCMCVLVCSSPYIPCITLPAVFKCLCLS